MGTRTADVFKMPLTPNFASLGQERQHRKERLAAAFRFFAKFGFDEGAAGHMAFVFFSSVGLIVFA